MRRWEDGLGDTGTMWRTFTIITPNANAMMAALHDRMPVIIERRTAAVVGRGRR
jgi:putative SOS response-associated peptidase YedK